MDRQVLNKMILDSRIPDEAVVVAMHYMKHELMSLDSTMLSIESWESIGEIMFANLSERPDAPVVTVKRLRMISFDYLNFGFSKFAFTLGHNGGQKIALPVTYCLFKTKQSKRDIFALYYHLVKEDRRDVDAYMAWRQECLETTGEAEIVTV